MGTLVMAGGQQWHQWPLHRQSGNWNSLKWKQKVTENLKQWK
jgi:ABC-type microcin C transport system permease subunit YejB